MKKSLFFLSILASCFGAFGQLTNNSFDLESYYGDLLMRRYVSGDLVWKRALVTGTNQLIVNYAGDYTNGTKIMGPQLLVDGKVGIGTSAPDAKLTVKGDIHAEEVKIDLNVPAPDYVFAKDYNLLTIEEVQQHIAAQGHLPNIPSATEMETNGVELGLMNMKLLEKIEELTLYTIAQEKEIKQLRFENKKQKTINNQQITNNQNLEARLAKIEELLKKK